MDQRTRNALRRPIEILFSAALVLILLTACGGDDEGDSPTETVPSDDAATPEGERESGNGVLATPAAVAVPAGTPAVSDASATPAVVVSSPPIDAPAEGATPADLTGAGTPEVVASAAPVAGDGTGGAALAPAVTEPSGDGAIVSSCDVTSFPPYSGDAPAQVTTVDVNFRAGPGTDCDALGEPLAAGTVVEVLSDPVTREGEPDLSWMAVAIDGTQGWLASDFLEPTEQ